MVSPEDPVKKRSGCKSSLIILGIVFLFFVFMFMQCRSCLNSTTTSDSTSSYQISSSIGSKITIPYLIVGTTKANWDELVSLASRKQHAAMMQMANNGQAFIVEDNTRAEVIDTSSLYMIQVRILDGQHQGKVGWLSSELL